MTLKEENEKKKEYLREYQAKQKAIRILEEEIRQLRHSKLSPAPIVYDDMPHGTDQRDLSDYAVALEKLDMDLRRARYKRITFHEDVHKRIEALENETEQNVLRLRYIHGKKWEDICEELDYEWAQTHRYHADALKNIVIPKDDTQ